MDEARPINLYEYGALARERLAPVAWDYYSSGALDEITLRANREAFDQIALRYRVLRGAPARDSSVSLLGRRHDWPLLVAPMAFARLAHDDGELAVARAAAANGVTLTLSTLATHTIEDVASASDHPKWFQLYVFHDRGLTADLVRRAEAAGYEALVLTVDAPELGRRERDARNRFSLPSGIEAANIASHLPAVTASEAGSGLAHFFATQIDPTLTWDDVDWLASLTRLPILLKGIVHPDDARLAVDHGAAGVIVSNHGGRQLDTTIASVRALPAVAEAIDGRCVVLLDGGVRRGTDIVKALALGADAVLVGRPILWGLAADGEAGVDHVLSLLRAEFAHAMLLCGAPTVAALTADLLA